MSWLSVLLGLVLGLIVGVVPVYMIQRRQERHARLTRWDSALYTLSVDFLSGAQRFRRLVSEAETAEDRTDYDRRIDDERDQMNALLVQLRLVGNVRVQRSARLVIRHSYAVLKVSKGEGDPRTDRFTERPSTRFSNELQEFVRACRHQLRVESPEEIASEEPSDWPELGPDRPRTRRILAPWR